MTTRTNTDNVAASRAREREENRAGTETKAAFKTTEPIVYVLAVIGVLIAAALVDNNFGADPAWRYVTYLTVGYVISRELAKPPAREGRGRVRSGIDFFRARETGVRMPRPLRVSETGDHETNGESISLSTDNAACLTRLTEALRQARAGPQARVVGYLEAVLEEVGFETSPSILAIRTEGP